MSGPVILYVALDKTVAQVHKAQSTLAITIPIMSFINKHTGATGKSSIFSYAEKLAVAGQTGSSVGE